MKIQRACYFPSRKINLIVCLNKSWFSEYCWREIETDCKYFIRWSYCWLHNGTGQLDLLVLISSAHLHYYFCHHRLFRTDVGSCGINRELKQTRRRQKRERHLKMWLLVSAIIMLEKRVLTILRLNWNQRLGHQKTKLNICHHMLASSTHPQNWSFHVVERTRTSLKCKKMKNARAKRARIPVFRCQICKFVRFLLPSSSWLRKLPNYELY